MAINERQTVLVVDDCPTNRELFLRLLQRDGYDLAEAEHGVQAIETARGVKPHVIVMDVMMPVMDGLEATRRLREEIATRRIPIIMVSARLDEDDVAAGLAAGADEYVFKPIRPRDFRLRVRSMVRLRETQLELERANAALTQRTALLAKLNQFCKGVLMDGSIDDIYARIVETAADLLESRRVSLLIPGAAGDLRIACALGIDEGDWRSASIPLDDTLSGMVYRTQSEMVVNRDTADVPPISRHESPCLPGIPLICSPLCSVQGPLGVLNVAGRRDEDDFAPEDIRILHQFCKTAAIVLNDLLTRRKLDEARDSIIFSLAKLSEYRHQETGKHLERVRALSVLLAEELRGDPRIPEPIDEQFLIDLRRAAPLHDIGKVAIPDQILLKPGALTDAEFRLMQNHSIIGAQTLESVIVSGHEAAFLRMAMDIARHHHERYDGTGYPDRLADDRIPLAARIVCLADSYDAIRTPREYKPARTHQEATRELLAGSGTQFDPRLVQTFLRTEARFRDIYEHYAEKEVERSPARTERELITSPPR